MSGSSVKFPQIGKIKTFGLPRQSAINWMVKQSWPTLTLTTFTLLFFLSVVFGALLYADNRYSANDDGSPGDRMTFMDCINLSIQTFSTIGFGSLGPTTSWANWIITIESFVALVCCALVPGVFFLKFSRPKAKVRWTRKILVGGAGPHKENGWPAPNADGSQPQTHAAAIGASKALPPTLTLRCANLRQNFHSLHGVRFDAVLYHTRDSIDETENYSTAVEMVDLPLNRSTFTAFGVPITLVHVLQRDSPLGPLLKQVHDMRAAASRQDLALDAKIDQHFSFSICVFMKATDPILQSTVISMANYKPSQLHCGHWRFRDTFDTTKKTVDVSHFDTVLPGLHIEAKDVAVTAPLPRPASTRTTISATTNTHDTIVSNALHKHDSSADNPMHEDSGSAKTPLMFDSHVGGNGQVSRYRASSMAVRQRSHRFRRRSSVSNSNISTTKMRKRVLHPSDNKVGAKSVIGAGYSVDADRYYSLITARWSTVIIVMAALYFGTALIFAVLVHVDPSPSGGVSDLGTADSQGRFGDAFFFSVQALSTIGYGSLSPETDHTNMVANFEAWLGVLLIAVINGIVWGKFFTVGRANAIFSESAVMMKPERADHTWDLALRIASCERGQALTHVKVEAQVILVSKTPGGADLHMTKNLKLERAYYPMLVHGEIVHRIDSDSPLYEYVSTPSTFKDKNIRICVFVEGVETIFKRDFFASVVYEPERILWGHKLSEVMFASSSTGFIFDMTRFHDVEPQSEDMEHNDSGSANSAVSHRTTNAAI